jgi:organic radical activating enzyme
MKPRTFAPDLIVEVTRACDRACVGCYAPNVLMKDGKAANTPGLFLSSSALKTALDALSERPRMVAVRGGEPSLHKDLERLLKLIGGRTDQIVLETHGRWILEDSPKISLEALSRLGITIKVSFDRMHAMSAESLRAVLQCIEASKMNYLVAITEATEEDFESIAASIAPFADRKQLVFQKKAIRAEELVKPRIGVIDVSGKLKLSLTTKLQTFDTQNVTLRRPA